jgi:hypothetical protein
MSSSTRNRAGLAIERYVAGSSFVLTALETVPHVNDPVGHTLDLSQPLCSQLLVAQDGRDQSSAATVDDME